MTNLKIAAAYIRVSTKDQLDNSPENQLLQIQHYADRNGFMIPEEYVFIDGGISGRQAMNRTAFQDMLAIAKQKPKPFDAILLWKFSRFARSRDDSILYKSLLRKKLDIEVISTTEDIGSGKTSIITEAIIEAMDEFYSINLSDDVKQNMIVKANRGEPLCRPPIGYSMKDKRYFPNEDAEVVKDIFNSYLAGEGMRAIAQRLSNMGVKTYFGNKLDNRFVEYVLRNPVYIGKIRWSSDGRAASKRDFDNENIILTEGLHEPIIGTETWEAAQKKLDEVKKLYGRYQRREQPTEWMLKGLVRCSACGATLVRLCTKTPSMQCHNYSRGSCAVSHSLSLAKADKAIEEELERAVTLMAFPFSSKNKKSPVNGADWSKLIKNERQKFERANDAYLAGVYSLDELSKTKQEIEKNIELYQSQMNGQIQEPTVDVEKFAQNVVTALEIIKNPDSTEQTKSIALRSVVENIKYDKPNGRLEIVYHI